ncbi:MAG: NADH-quinone oxidoreductase subunit J, partial [Candidatus Thiodiazotropha sp. (ex Lucinoma borealis)]|nr:NADH-quinone oxidoreductase subunit J [Candidatus Thiodiazotropha sp. (ex Lucinoma borealis)]
MLAFSSIGQLGVIFIAVALPDERGVLAVLALSLHHMLIKSGLFMLADHWGGSLERLRGIATTSPLAVGLFVLFALSLVGMPPLPGFWAKFTLITELAGQTDPLYMIGLLVFLLATVIEASYLFRVAAKMYQTKPTDIVRSNSPDSGSLSLTTASLFGAGLIAATVMVSPLGDGLQAIAVQAQDVDLYIQTVLQQPLGEGQ